MNRIQKKEKGFTLIEVMVVIAILAIISTITIVSINRTKQNVNDKQMIQDLNEIRAGLDQYKAVCKMYPLELDVNENSGLGGTGVCSKKLGEIMPHLSDIVISDFSYYPLSRNSSSGYCSGYWIAVKLDSSNGQLTQPENITPSEMQVVLTNNGGITGGWARCAGSNAQLPLNNGGSANSYFGETSSGVY